ncbi:MAG TPA: hypothetical protein VJQ26_00165 [Ktedonobacteraceae bacterium]|nr:hypothetical protein [Ktedonobacteraceae bacterium]
MQRIPFRKVKTSVYHVQPTEDDILHFSLDGLLPESHTLALNLYLGTLSLLASSPTGSYPYLLAEQQFTGSELSVIVPLLKYYPHYCPYEVLLASFNYGNISETMIERSRKRLHEAQLEGIWDQEMRPVRNVLSRARLKMRAFRIEISSILETGYILMVLSERKRLEA